MRPPQSTRSTLKHWEKVGFGSYGPNEDLTETLVVDDISVVVEALGFNDCLQSRECRPSETASPAAARRLTECRQRHEGLPRFQSIIGGDAQTLLSRTLDREIGDDEILQ